MEWSGEPNQTSCASKHSCDSVTWQHFMPSLLKNGMDTRVEKFTVALVFTTLKIGDFVQLSVSYQEVYMHGAGHDTNLVHAHILSYNTS